MRASMQRAQQQSKARSAQYRGDIFMRVDAVMREQRKRYMRYIALR